MFVPCKLHTTKSLASTLVNLETIEIKPERWNNNMVGETEANSYLFPFSWWVCEPLPKEMIHVTWSLLLLCEPKNPNCLFHSKPLNAMLMGLHVVHLLPSLHVTALCHQPLRFKAAFKTQTSRSCSLKALPGISLCNHFLPISGRYPQIIYLHLSIIVTQ